MTIQHVRKWCRYFNMGRTELEDKSRSGRPSVVTPRLLELVEKEIRKDRRVMYAEIEAAIPDGISHSVLQTIIHDHLKFTKVCARWVPKDLSEAMMAE